ncbi:helix-turn-helix domain-containing protein, partial [Streptomyces sp. URMC 126]|uniref:helix-turn-helix domain-containing protein n=1 Tax=Streptomyces sp. URMC 126 TaxID=3423401 RepID=UPI003F1D5424
MHHGGTSEYGGKGRVMPRWRALPDELDPQVREFASQLRRLVDRSGLSISAVADRTGYSKTSWER